jgi:hypothetical protein
MSSDGWFYEANGERRGPLTLEQMRTLVKAGGIRRDTRVWRPGADAADLTRAGDFLAELAAVADDNNELRHILPVGRSGWAIAAGYLGLFSLAPFICYFGVVVSIVAAIDLRRHPKKLGWGRVITGFVISVPMSLLYTWLLLFHH